MPDMIKFGTDGWRAVIAEDFTFANVRACAQGVAISKRVISSFCPTSCSNIC